MEKRRADGRDVHAHAGEDTSDGDRVTDIRVPVLAPLRAMGLLSEDEGTLHQVEVRLRVLFRESIEDILNGGFFPA